MKFLFDLFPVVFFFISYKFWGIYFATGVAILISFIQVLYSYIKLKKIDSLQILTLVLLILLGGATIWFHDERFIKWKPSIINWILAVLFLGSELFSQKTFIQLMMGGNNLIELSESNWKKLNRSWAGFFMLMGFVNLYVIYHFDTNTWVNFKLFGMLGLTFVFIILQSIYLAKHVKLAK